MLNAEQFRAKAAEFRALLTNIARSPNETREFRDLEQTCTKLAENEEWMAVHSHRSTRAHASVWKKTQASIDNRHQTSDRLASGGWCTENSIVNHDRIA